jgi:hypothetical protein
VDNKVEFFPVLREHPNTLKSKHLTNKNGVKEVTKLIKALTGISN